MTRELSRAIRYELASEQAVDVTPISVSRSRVCCGAVRLYAISSIASGAVVVVVEIMGSKGGEGGRECPRVMQSQICTYGTKEEYTKGEHTNGTESRPRAATWIGL